MALLRQHHVTDADPVVEAFHARALHPLARGGDDALRLVVVRRQVMVGDDHDLLRVPDLRAEPLEHRLHPPRAARVMHHREVDLAGHDLAGRDDRSPRGAGDELLGKGLRAHIPRYARLRSLRASSSAGVPLNAIAPFSSTYARCAISSDCATFCSTSRIASPSPLSRFTSANISPTRSGASPSEGSSRISSRGSDMSPRPIASICCSPPESVPARCMMRSFRRGKAPYTRSRLAARRARPRR